MTPVGNIRPNEPPHGPVPNHHLTDELLLDYAAGGVSEAVSLIVATHLTLCPACRERAQVLDSLGGVLMERIDPVAVADDMLSGLWARIEQEDGIVDREAPSPAPNERPLATDTRALPRPVQHYLDGDLDAVRWQPIGMGVEISDVVTDNAGYRAFLLKVPGGRAVPKHTHMGNEYVLVLNGAFRDECGHFRRGDIEIADDSVEHRPIADVGEDCICLAVTDAPLRMTGAIGWLLNRFSKL